MKVFISHKKEDEDIAQKIHLLLKLRDVAAYLDLLDPSIVDDGKALTDHIKKELNDCTDIMVIMSEKTRYSQWVLPSFLKYWPRLRRPSDVDEYIAARQKATERMNALYEHKEFASRNKIETDMFYRQLKSQLGQS